MSALNLSTNGPAISASYNKIVNAQAPSNPSPTYGQWALYTVQAPLVSAFQNDGGKESVLKVQTTGEGELQDLVEDMSDGRIQFAFVKVKDPNTTLPKSVLVAWCGEGVPERTKGYFTSHLNAVSKVLRGYHVQITARSDRDLTPEMMVQKVADASGSTYSGG
ncbi:actin binding protein, partial [Friedmanniomyces endolithicus]